MLKGVELVWRKSGTKHEVFFRKPSEQDQVIRFPFPRQQFPGCPRVRPLVHRAPSFVSKEQPVLSEGTYQAQKKRGFATTRPPGPGFHFLLALIRECGRHDLSSRTQRVLYRVRAVAEMEAELVGLVRVSTLD